MVIGLSFPLTPPHWPADRPIRRQDEADPRGVRRGREGEGPGGRDAGRPERGTNAVKSVKMVGVGQDLGEAGVRVKFGVGSSGTTNSRRVEARGINYPAAAWSGGITTPSQSVTWNNAIRLRSRGSFSVASAHHRSLRDGAVLGLKAHGGSGGRDPGDAYA